MVKCEAEWPWSGKRESRKMITQAKIKEWKGKTQKKNRKKEDTDPGEMWHRITVIWKKKESKKADHPSKKMTMQREKHWKSRKNTTNLVKCEAKWPRSGKKKWKKMITQAKKIPMEREKQWKNRKNFWKKHYKLGEMWRRTTWTWEKKGLRKLITQAEKNTEEGKKTLEKQGKTGIHAKKSDELWSKTT